MMEKNACKVYVTHIVNPQVFWARLGTDESFAVFDEFEAVIQKYCSEYQGPPCNELQVGQIVLAKNGSGTWQRGSICGIYSSEREADVLAVDCYTTEIIPFENIISPVPESLAHWGPQAWKCCLYNVRPIASSWISRASEYFSDLVLHEVIDGEVVLVDEQETLFLDLFVEESETSIKGVDNILIDAGLAMVADEEENKEEAQIPSFDIDILSRTVRRPQRADSDESVDFERDFHCRDLVRSESLQNYELTDYLHEVTHAPSQFGSITDQIAETRQAVSATSTGARQNIQSTSGSNETKTSPRGAAVSKAQTENKKPKSSPARSRNRNKDSRRVKDQSQRVGSDSRPGPKSLKPRQVISPGVRKSHPSGSPARSSPARDPPNQPRIPAQTSKKEKAQNEHEWQSYMLENKLEKHIKMHQEAGDLSSMIQGIHEYLNRANPIFEKLSGPNEIHVCLNVILKKVIKDRTFHSTAVYLLQSMLDFPGCANIVSEVLWEQHTACIKNGSDVEIRSNLCRFLGELFTKMLEWNENQRHSIQLCVINMIELWEGCIDLTNVNHATKRTQPSCIEHYINCLREFLMTGGPAFKVFQPSAYDRIANVAKDSMFKQQVPLAVKEKLLELVQFMADRRSHDAERAVCRQAPAKPRPCVSSQVTQTQIKTFHDVALQVDISPPSPTPEPERLQRSNSTQDSLFSFGMSDVFRQIKLMLTALQLEELFETFEENALTDQVLELDFEDLKPVLKECGLKIGHILLIKSYMKDPVKRQRAEDASIESQRDQSFSQPASNPEPINSSQESLRKAAPISHPVNLISPAQFQMASREPPQAATFPTEPATDYVRDSVSPPRAVDNLYEPESPTNVPSYFRDQPLASSKSDLDQWRAPNEPKSDINGYKLDGNTFSPIEVPDARQIPGSYSAPVPQNGLPYASRSHQSTIHKSDTVYETAANGAENKSAHPCKKYNLKSLKPLVQGIVKTSPDTLNPTAKEKAATNHQPVWSDIPSEIVLSPPINLRPEEFPALNHMQGSPDLSGSPKLSSESSISPPTPRSYLPPPPVEPTPSPSDTLQYTKRPPQTPGFAEAVDMSYTTQGILYAKPTQKPQMRWNFGRNRRCTACQSYDHIIDDCPDKSQLFKH